jgi:hypothetical protein
MSAHFFFAAAGMPLFHSYSVDHHPLYDGLESMETIMRNAKWIAAILGLAVLTAGCVQDNRYYPNTGYNAPRGGGGYWNSARRDADRDGVPNRYDRDANGDGVPDRYQGRPRS